MKLVRQACWLTLVIPTAALAATGSHQLDPEDPGRKEPQGLRSSRTGRDQPGHDDPREGERDPRRAACILLRVLHDQWRRLWREGRSQRSRQGYRQGTL